MAVDGGKLRDGGEEANPIAQCCILRPFVTTGLGRLPLDPIGSIRGSVLFCTPPTWPPSFYTACPVLPTRCCCDAAAFLFPSRVRASLVLISRTVSTTLDWGVTSLAHSLRLAERERKIKRPTWKQNKVKQENFRRKPIHARTMSNHQRDGKHISWKLWGPEPSRLNSMSCSLLNRFFFV